MTNYFWAVWVDEPDGERIKVKKWGKHYEYEENGNYPIIIHSDKLIILEPIVPCKTIRKDI
jgi:hypothetical protein